MRSLDRIREFSELGEFFDEPIYSYSSGMAARLGFATALEVDPDVMLIDEMLVGRRQQLPAKVGPRRSSQRLRARARPPSSSRTTRSTIMRPVQPGGLDRKRPLHRRGRRRRSVAAAYETTMRRRATPPASRTDTLAPMIYLDVTSAAASPMNMGVHRTVRGLWACTCSKFGGPDVDAGALGFLRASATPDALAARAGISLNRALRLLWREAKGTPGRWDLRHLLSRACKETCTSRGERGVADESLLKRPGSTLLIPDLCWDARIHAWARMAAHSRAEKRRFFTMPCRCASPAGRQPRRALRQVREKRWRISTSSSASRRRSSDDLLALLERISAWKAEADGASCRGRCRSMSGAQPNESAEPGRARKIIYVARLKLRKESPCPAFGGLRVALGGAASNSAST